MMLVDQGLSSVARSTAPTIPAEGTRPDDGTCSTPALMTSLTPTSRTGEASGCTSASSAPDVAVSSSLTRTPGSQSAARSAVRACKGPCGRTLPLTREHFYANNTLKSGEPAFRWYCIPCFLEGKKPSTPAQVEVARAYYRGVRAMYRQDPEKLERMRENDRASKRRTMQRMTRREREAHNAAVRARYEMRERMRMDADGRDVQPAPPITRAKGDATRVDSDSFPALPAGPLLAVIARMVLAERASASANPLYVPSSENEEHGGQGSVCSRVGVIERRLSEWRRGLATAEALIGPRLPGPRFVARGPEPYPFVSFDLADRFLTLSGLLWHDVWSADDVARNGRSVEWVFESTEVSHAA